MEAPQRPRSVPEEISGAKKLAEERKAARQWLRGREGHQVDAEISVMLGSRFHLGDHKYDLIFHDISEDQFFDLIAYVFGEELAGNFPANFLREVAEIGAKRSVKRWEGK